MSPYDRIIHRKLDGFAGTLEGNEAALFCVVSTGALSQQARNALAASAKRLGYSPQQMCFIALAKADGDAGHPGMLPSQPDVSPQQLLETIEAIDPLCIVLTDRTAAETASAGYNTPLSLGTKEFLLGRGCCCFDAFESLLESEQGKRTAWNCLKTLPFC